MGLLLDVFELPVVVECHAPVVGPIYTEQATHNCTPLPRESRGESSSEATAEVRR